MKNIQLTIDTRNKELISMGFVFRINGDWHHPDEPVMISKEAVNGYSEEQWERLMDQTDCFLNRD